MFVIVRLLIPLWYRRILYDILIDWLIIIWRQIWKG